MASSLNNRLLRSRLFAALASPRAGVVLAALVTVQLMASSLFIPSPRSKDRLPFSESIATFRDAPIVDYWWFWALAATTGLLALSTIFGGTRALIQRAATGRLDRRFWGITLMHLGFVVGLGAHLVAADTAGVTGQVMLGPDPVAVGRHELRVIEGSTRDNPDGTLLSVDALVEDEAGQQAHIGFNRPWFYDGFRRWVLVQGAQASGSTPVFVVDGQPRRLSAGQAIEAAGHSWTVQRVSDNPTLRSPMVLLSMDGAAPSWIAPGWSAEGLSLQGFDQAFVVSALLRRNDGIPWLMLAMALFSAGVGLFEWGRRWPGAQHQARP